MRVETMRGRWGRGRFRRGCAAALPPNDGGILIVKLAKDAFRDRLTEAAGVATPRFRRQEPPRADASVVMLDRSRQSAETLPPPLGRPKPAPSDDVEPMDVDEDADAESSTKSSKGLKGLASPCLSRPALGRRTMCVSATPHASTAQMSCLD